MKNNFKDQKIRVVSKNDNGTLNKFTCKLEDYNAGNIPGEIITIEPYAGKTKDDNDIFVNDIVTSWCHNKFSISPVVYRGGESTDIFGYALNTVKYFGSGSYFKNLGRMNYEFNHDVMVNDIHSFINYYFEVIAKFLGSSLFKGHEYKTTMCQSGPKVTYLSIEKRGIKNEIGDIEYKESKLRKGCMVFTCNFYNSDIGVHDTITHHFENGNDCKYKFIIEILNKLLVDLK